MANVSRQQLIVERFLEDERLRGDLEDAPAKALLDWATAQAGPIAADNARSDEDVDAAVQAVRKAAMQAARSGESDPKKVVAQAAAALEATPAASPASAQAAASPPPKTLSEREAGAGAPQPAASSTDNEQKQEIPSSSDAKVQPAASSTDDEKKADAPASSDAKIQPAASSAKDSKKSDAAAPSGDTPAAAKPEHVPARKPQRRRNRFAKLLKQMRRGK